VILWGWKTHHRAAREPAGLHPFHGAGQGIEACRFGFHADFARARQLENLP
jgi:hypothetical protein